MKPMIPPAYAWLGDEPGPKMIVEARALIGVHETVGADDNPDILAWAKETKLDGVYKHDATAWCGLFMAVVAQRAGKVVPPGPLWAKNWRKFGQGVGAPMLGDVLVFSRDGGGHVALYVGEDATAFHILGGNQRDQVSIVRKARSECIAARRPLYSVQPANVRSITLSALGALSVNEA